MKIGFKKHQRGVTTIEFSFGAFLLFWIVFACFELSRFFYCINLVETAVRDAVRDTRLTTHIKFYEDAYHEYLVNDNKVWRFVVGDIKPYPYMFYYHDLDEVLGNITNADQSLPFAKVFVKATYTPLLFLTDLISIDIERSALLVQEHEGWNPK